MAFLLLVIGCNSQEAEKNTGKSDEIPLTGVWGAVDYFDSILCNKAISRYTGGSHEIAVLMDFSAKDSVLLWGSIYCDYFPVRIDEDTLANFKINNISVTHGTWRVLKKDTLIELIDPKGNKTTYRRRDDLKFLIRNINVNVPSGENISKYFSSNLISGSYLNPENNQTVIFGTDESLSGFMNFSKFSVVSHFNTFHPAGDEDLICFFEDLESYTCGWEFHSDTLKLYPMVYEIEMHEGKEYVTDNITRSGECIILIKKKNDI